MAAERSGLPQTKICKDCKEEKTLDQYHRNKACKFGVHTLCKVCNNAKSRKWLANNPEKAKATHQAYYDANKKEINAKNIANYYKNHEAYLATRKRWKAVNHAKVIQNVTERKRKVQQATPAWLTEEQRSQIENFYWLANDLKTINGEDYHVDHIVPLRGENVCGLHVPWNLQVLPSDMNLSKGNKHGDIA